MDTLKSDLDEDNTFEKETLLCEIGAKLQQARETKGFSQEQVVKALKFNISFLQAMESGNWMDMPGEIYALGFLRQYAELLDLDVSADVQRIKTNSYALTAPLTYPDAPISPNRTWVVVAVLLFILMMIITNLLSFSDDESSVATTAKSIPSEVVESQPQSVMKTLEIETSPPQSSPLKIQEESNVEPEATSPAFGKHTYTFTAVSDDVWLQIFQEIEDAEPKMRREALLRAGQSFSLKSNSNLLITSGKPTALEILIDDEVIFAQGKLGQEGKVLKMFPLQ